MKILLSVGHSRLKNGYYTSADGRPFGGVLEYEYNKKISGQVAEYLRSAGHSVYVLICPEGRFAKSTEEKTYKLNLINGNKYDLVVELHLNATALHNARGCEVLYGSESGRKAAEKIQARLSTVFANRGVQRRTGLYMLNSLKYPSVIIESFFCDSSKDCEVAMKNNVPLLIAEGIHGSSIVKHTTETKQNETKTEQDDFLFRFRICTSALSIREGAGAEYKKVGEITDKNVYTIIETKTAKDGGTWGKLKSGAGWINVSSKFINKI